MENAVSLREHIDALIEALSDRIDDRFTASDKLVNTRFDSSQREVESARFSMEKRLDGMNEFRETLKDQAATLAKRESVDEVNRRLNAIENKQSGLEGRLVVFAIISVFVQVGGLLIAFWKLSPTQP